LAHTPGSYYYYYTGKEWPNTHTYIQRYGKNNQKYKTKNLKTNKTTKTKRRRRRKEENKRKIKKDFRRRGERKKDTHYQFSTKTRPSKKKDGEGRV